MKKILISLSVLFVFCVGTSYAGIECQYYTIENNIWSFNELDKKEIKELSEIELKNYKNIKKAEKYMQKANVTTGKKQEKFYLKALQYNNSLMPAIDGLAWYYFYNSNHNKAIEYANYVLQNGIQDNELLQLLGYSYYNLRGYLKAYEYFKKVIESDLNINEDLKNSIYFYISSSALHITDNNILNLNNEDITYLNEAIKYADLIINLSKYEYPATDIKYIAFSRLQKTNLALKEAKKLVSLNNNFDNNLKLATCTTDIDKKIEILYKAKNLATNDNQIWLVNGILNLNEQNKIDNAVKSLGKYVKKPVWIEICENVKYGDLQYWSNRQDKFFESTTHCIKNYKSDNLVACFNQVNIEQEKLTKKLEEDVFKQQQLQYQNALLHQQELANYYRLQSTYAQQQNLYYQQQNYLNNTQPKTYQVTPVGNSLYIYK